MADGKIRIGLEVDDSGFASKVKASAQSAGQGAGDSIGSAMQGGISSKGVAVAAAIGSVVAQAASKAAAVIADAMGDAVARVDTLANFPRVMTALGYSADSAEASIAKMSERLQGLPTTLVDMSTTVQGLAAITGDLDLATDAGLALNDMLLAGGQSTAVTSAAMEQFRQILSKGKPELQDWKSLMSAAPGQMKQLAQAMLGPTATADDLYKALGGGGSQATISMDELLQAMIRLDTEGGEGITSFQEQAATATGGIQTSMSNLRNAVVIGLAEVIEAFGQSNIAAPIQGMSEAIKAGFGEVATWVQPIMDFLALFEPALGVVNSLLASFGEVFNAYVAPALQAIGPQLVAIATNLQPIWAVLQPVGSFLGAVLGVALMLVVNVLNILLGIQVAVTSAVSDFANFLLSIPATAEQFSQGLQAVFQALPGILAELLGLMAAGVSSGLQAIGGFFTNIWNAIVSTVSGAMSRVAQGVSSGFNNVVSFVRGIPGKITGALGNAGNILLSAGKSIIDGFLRGLRDSWKGVTDFVGGIADWIAANKGPLSYDARLLVPHGLAIMRGLAEGLDEGFGDVEGLVGSMAEGIAVGVGAVPLDLTTVGATVGAVEVQAQAAQAAGVTQTVNFNQPVTSPDELARAMRMQARYGLAGAW